MSTRKSIVDRVVALLAARDNTIVTEDAGEFWADPVVEDPKLLIESTVRDTERSAFPHDTADDMEETLEITISGRIHTSNEGRAAAVDSVVEDIDPLLDDTTLQGYLIDIVKESVEIKLWPEREGYFVATYVATYQYNHNSP